jgi:hypothetical protein
MLSSLSGVVGQRRKATYPATNSFFDGSQSTAAASALPANLSNWALLTNSAT